VHDVRSIRRPLRAGEVAHGHDLVVVLRVPPALERRRRIEQEVGGASGIAASDAVRAASSAAALVGK
jgi:hypothetical protein